MLILDTKEETEAYHRDPSHYQFRRIESGDMRLPRSMTLSTLRVFRMSSSGLARSTTRSATFPGAIRPSESTPRSNAPFRVAASNAVEGVSPAATRSSISRCSLNPGIRS